MEKYFLIIDDYRLSIFLNGYLGASTEINGSIVIKKGEVDGVLSPIRGTGLSLSLEANVGLTFEDFITEKEGRFTVTLTKDNVLIYKGFIKPDGIEQSFVTNTWLISVDVIDGLGALKDLSFTKQNNLPYTGKVSIYEVIKACLDKTTVLLPVYSSINLVYDGYNGTNILKDSFVNSLRYIKDDNNTLMNCEEVLESTLRLFSAVVHQENGAWWIYNPLDLAPSTTFINNVNDTTFTKKTDYNLGSQIDNFFPHHCESNQRINIKPAISAYRLKYEYGFLTGFIGNSNLIHNEDLIFEDWDSDTDFQEYIDDSINYLSYLRVKCYEEIETLDPDQLLNPYGYEVILNLTSQITINAGVSFEFTGKVKSLDRYTIFVFSVKNSNNNYLKNDGTWSSQFNYITIGSNPNTTTDFAIKAQAHNQITTLEVQVGLPYFTSTTNNPQGHVPVILYGEIRNVNIVDTSQIDKNIKGEFYTGARDISPSSIVKENETVINGDSAVLINGTIFKGNTVNPTTKWNGKPILSNSVINSLRVQRNSTRLFSGSILGHFNYLSVISINNIFGKYMFTSYSYDIRNNKISAELTQFYNDLLNDVQVEITKDYGTTTKPTIKS